MKTAACSQLQVRAHVEKQIALVAEGKAEKADVVEHTLQQFLQKYLFFRDNVQRMDSLFEASFSPLTASGVQFVGQLASQYDEPLQMDCVCTTAWTKTAQGLRHSAAVMHCTNAWKSSAICLSTLQASPLACVASASAT